MRSWTQVPTRRCQRHRGLRMRRVSLEVLRKRRVLDTPPKMKCATAKIWHRSIMRPNDSLTTLKPRDTIKSRKKERALRPASRMATAHEVSELRRKDPYGYRTDRR